MDFDCLVGSLCFGLIAQNHWKQKIFIQLCIYAAKCQLSVWTNEESPHWLQHTRTRVPTTFHDRALFAQLFLW